VERSFRLRWEVIGPDCTGRGEPEHRSAPCARIRSGGSTGGVQCNESSRATLQAQTPLPPHDPARVNAPNPHSRHGTPTYLPVRAPIPSLSSSPGRVRKLKLGHAPESLSSDDPARLVETLAALAKEKR